MAGYAPKGKGYMLWHAKLNKLILSRDMKVDESITDPQSEVENESKSSSESNFSIKFYSESDKNDEETTQIEDSEELAYEGEVESENEDQIASQI